jgi:hypothetical protein
MGLSMKEKQLAPVTVGLTGSDSASCGSPHPIYLNALYAHIPTGGMILIDPVFPGEKLLQVHVRLQFAVKLFHHLWLKMDTLSHLLPFPTLLRQRKPYSPAFPPQIPFYEFKSVVE